MSTFAPTNRALTKVLLVGLTVLTSAMLAWRTQANRQVELPAQATSLSTTSPTAIASSAVATAAELLAATGDESSPTSITPENGREDDLRGEPAQSDLLVTVDTASASPENVLVALTVTNAQLQSTERQRAATDDLGRVRFGRQQCATANPDEVVCVDIGFPSTGAYAMQIDAETDELRFFAPDHGKLHLEFVEANGSRIRTPAILHVRVLAATPPANRMHTYEVMAGEVDIPVEASGLPLEVSATTHDGRHLEAQLIHGPASAGSITECVLRMAPRPMITARVLDANGQPAPNTQVQVHRKDSLLRLDEGLATDAEGRLEIPCPNSLSSAQNWHLLLQCRLDDGKLWYAEVAADLLPGSGQDLGDVWLRATEALVSGVCLNQALRARPGVMLRLQVHSDDTTDQHRIFGRDNFRNLPMDAVRTAEDGTFVIYGPPQHGRTLRIYAQGHPHTVMLIDAGAVNVEFVLPIHRRPRIFR